MRILMMSNTYTPIVGGIEAALKSYKEELARKGHDVRIVAPEFKGMPPHEEGVIRIPAIQKFIGTDFSVNLPVPGLLSKFMETFNPDVIHSHHPFLVGDLAIRLSHKYHVPIVFTYHIMFEEYIDYLPIHNTFFKNFVVELAAGYANLADHVIVPSRYVGSVLQDRGVRTPIDIIPTGVDTNKFASGSGTKFRQKWGISPKAFVAGYVGRLTPEKNLGFLAKAMVGFLAKDKNAHSLFIGQGPQLEVIQSIFTKAGLSQRLHTVGVLHDQELVDGYRAMDVFAFSSPSETQGLVLLEALACGVPVVTIDYLPLRDFIEDHKNGRLIEGEDMDAFITALFWYARLSAAEAEVIKQNALSTGQKFSLIKCTEDLLGVYQRLMQNYVYQYRSNNIWRTLMDQLSIEVDLFKNMVESGEDALKETFAKRNHHEQRK